MEEIVSKIRGILFTKMHKNRPIYSKRTPSYEGVRKLFLQSLHNVIDNLLCCQRMGMLAGGCCLTRAYRAVFDMLHQLVGRTCYQSAAILLQEGGVALLLPR